MAKVDYQFGIERPPQKLGNLDNGLCFLYSVKPGEPSQLYRKVRVNYCEGIATGVTVIYLPDGCYEYLPVNADVVEVFLKDYEVKYYLEIV